MVIQHIYYCSTVCANSIYGKFFRACVRIALKSHTTPANAPKTPENVDIDIFTHTHKTPVTSQISRSNVYAFTLCENCVKKR